jgi:flagellar hook protein FlgE
MDVIGNNIANVNTTAYKSARVEYADSFSQTYVSSSPGDGTSSNTAALQIGTGVRLSAIKNLYSQGAISRTGIGTDLAISGDGFFVVRDPVADIQYATRAGNFRLDESGYVVTHNGFRLQGYTDMALTTLGDVVVDDLQRPATADPAATLTSFSINRDGEINVRLSDGAEYVRGQLLLQNFTSPEALAKEGENLYSGMAAAGPLAALSAPQTSGLGRIEAGALELSNVDLASEFAGLITTQRAFQANARIITTSDEMLQELVNLKR